LLDGTGLAPLGLTLDEKYGHVMISLILEHRVSENIGFGSEVNSCSEINRASVMAIKMWIRSLSSYAAVGPASLPFREEGSL